MPIPPLYTHQQYSKDFILNHDRSLDLSDPGTGKTRAHLEAFYERKQTTGKKGLVLAPKSILLPAWGNDAAYFTPELTTSIAYASNRAKAFELPADLYITNHDAVNWLLDNQTLLDEFDTLIIDEFTAYKHRTSRRSKAINKLRQHFEFRTALSGTPNPNTILDLWHPTLLVDDGERLGRSFWKFRNTVCTPEQQGPAANMVRWVDKEGIEDVVALLLEDITIRHRFEDCIDIPPNHTHTINFALSPQNMRQYLDMKRNAILQLADSDITAVHAASLTNKLLQIASGAVYDGDHVSKTLNTERYELIIELVKHRPASVVAFTWTHQRDELIRHAEREGIAYGVIDGSIPITRRNDVVEEFQAGNLQVIFAYPGSAGHGLTLTRGTATIWASPTYNAEHFQQFNRRIYRAGQDKITETILIAADNTLEPLVYEKLNTKLTRMDDLLTILQTQAA